MLPQVDRRGRPQTDPRLLLGPESSWPMGRSTQGISLSWARRSRPRPEPSDAELTFDFFFQQSLRRALCTRSRGVAEATGGRRAACPGRGAATRARSRAKEPGLVGDGAFGPWWSTPGYPRGAAAPDSGRPPRARVVGARPALGGSVHFLFPC